MDIHHKEFSTVRVGGYNKEEVDSFLDMVADELDRLLHRNQEQAELVESMRQKATQFDNMQTTLQNALINAQKSADSIVEEARIQAESQLGEAREQSARLLEEAQAEKARIYQSFAGIREQVLRYIATIRELLDNNQALVRDYEVRLAAMELKEAPAPTVTAPSDAATMRAGSPEVQTEREPQMPEPITSEDLEAPKVDVEPQPVPGERPPIEEAGGPVIPEFKVTQPLDEKTAPGAAAAPSEPQQWTFEEERPARPTPSPPPAQPEVPQVGEQIEEGMRRDSYPINADRKAPERTAGEPSKEVIEGEEKHFFWE
jgi:cell division initiation protein